MKAHTLLGADFTGALHVSLYAYPDVISAVLGVLPANALPAKLRFLFAIFYHIQATASVLSAKLYGILSPKGVILASQSSDSLILLRSLQLKRHLSFLCSTH